MSQQLNQTIAALRKEKRLTQEQLGALVGVSAQAVSKWEKGGTPDVELLPLLADTLGVTLDTLFGRASDKTEDISQTLVRWLDSLPPKDRILPMFKLLAGSFSHLVAMDASISDILQPMSAVLPTCYTTDGTWLRSGLDMDQGFALGVFSEDFPLYMLLPEPPAGYASQFAPPENYRTLFSILSREGALELIYYLYSRTTAYYTVTALSDRVGLSAQQTESLLETMRQCQLVSRTTIETREGAEPVYALNDNGGLIPFLYMARWFMEKSRGWYMQWSEREKPALRPTDPAAGSK